MRDYHEHAHTTARGPRPAAAPTRRWCNPLIARSPVRAARARPEPLQAHIATHLQGLARLRPSCGSGPTGPGALTRVDAPRFARPPSSGHPRRPVRCPPGLARGGVGCRRRRVSAGDRRLGEARPASRRNRRQHGPDVVIGGVVDRAEASDEPMVQRRSRRRVVAEGDQELPDLVPELGGGWRPPPAGWSRVRRYPPRGGGRPTAGGRGARWPGPGSRSRPRPRRRCRPGGWPLVEAGLDHPGEEARPSAHADQAVEGDGVARVGRRLVYAHEQPRSSSRQVMGLPWRTITSE
jgi:hypothetical protein